MTNRISLVVKRPGVPSSVSRALRYSTTTAETEVRLFRVRNTADRRVWILTSTSEGAVEIAYWDNLIRDRANAVVQEWTSQEPPSILSNCWSAVQRAGKERRQGKIEPNGNFVVIRGSVVSPISSVE